MSKPALKPCVKCGDKNPWLRGNTHTCARPYVECRCGHTSAIMRSSYSAINIWNKAWENKQKYDELKQKYNELKQKYDELKQKGFE